MTNQEQLSLLKNSSEKNNDSEKWNDWRFSSFTEVIDLQEADLNKAFLNEAYLNEANLRKAHLRKAHLAKTFLSGADLQEAYLSGSNLSEAYLDGANLTGAHLDSTHLTDANLTGADLTGADLIGANLIGVCLNNTNLSGANLSGQDLSDKDLTGVNLIGANLSGANLSGQDLSDKDLMGVNFSGANLSGANLSGQDLSSKILMGTILRGANLSGANLSGQDLGHKDLSGANLSGANLSKTLLIETNFTGATLSDCTIYGIAAWNVQLENAVQKNLTITQKHEATITIDNLKVAQFIYLMLKNEEIRDVINTLTTKSVLILGRFTPERKAILEALREALRNHNYLPVLFDFEKPRDRNLTETVKTLAHLARFIIADLTEPSSIAHELQAIIPTLAVSVQPILLEDRREYALFHDFSRYHWILPTYFYEDQAKLLSSIETKIIQPAEQKAKELEDTHK